MAKSLFNPFAVKDIIEGGKAFAENIKASFEQAEQIKASLPPGTKFEDLTFEKPLPGAPDETIQAPDGEPIAEFFPEQTLPGIPVPELPQTRGELLQHPRTSLRRPTKEVTRKISTEFGGVEVVRDVTSERQKIETEMNPFEREVTRTIDEKNLNDFILTFAPGPESIAGVGAVAKGSRGKKIAKKATDLFDKIRKLRGKNKKLSPLVKEGGDLKVNLFDEIETEISKDLPPFLREEVKKQETVKGKLEVFAEFLKSKKDDLTKLERLGIEGEAAKIVSAKPTIQPKVTFNDLDQLIKDKVVTKEEVYDMAAQVAKDPTKVAISTEFQSMAENLYFTEALKFNEFTRAVGTNPTPKQTQALNKRAEELWDLSSATRLLTGSSARSLSLSRARPKTVADAAHKAVKKVIKDLPEADAKELHRAILEAGNDPEKVHEAIAKFTTTKFGDKFLEFAVNGMLSNVVKTGYRNVAGSFMSMVLNTARQPIEVGVEATRALVGRRPREVFASEIIPGIAAGVKTTPQSALELVSDLFKIVKLQPVQGKIRTGDPIGRIGAIPGKLGEFVRTPGKLLTTFDKPFKEFVEAQSKKRFELRGAKGVKTLDIEERANKEALEVLFQAQLGPTGKEVAKLLGSNTLLASQFPFIRTGINILKESTKHTPFGFFMAAGKDNPEFARQMAKPILGSTIMFGMTMVALGESDDGRPIVTASAPQSNQGEREQFYATQAPNSILIDGKYVPYKDLEPVALPIALAAKAAQQIKENPTPDSPGDIFTAGGDLLNLGAFEIAKNFSDKSFMKTLGEFSRALTMGETTKEGQVEKFIASRSSILVPNIVSSFARGIDPTIRVQETPEQVVKAQLPGISRTIPAKRNIFGEAIKRTGGLSGAVADIFPKFTPSTDPLREELRNIKVTIQPISRVVDGVRLNAEQYENLQIIAGKKFKEKMELILNQPGYEEVPNAAKEQAIKKSKSNSDKEGRLLYQLNFQEGFKESIKSSKTNQIKFWTKYLESTSVKAARMTDSEREAFVKKNLNFLMEEKFDNLK